ncbi:MAG: DUF4129 domain-containing protein [Cyanobacteria bacterium SZAS LIN-2]|nr:DUF4129 domain-containing protein [Cyanobacteria bacterium SZAS LIN-3]MBS1994977.1 DUF4129 domain-containing protein [Cyanobacteria bacterium SZAS LIN-2]
MEFKNISHDLEEIARNYDYRQPPDFLLKIQDFLTYISRLIRDVLSYLRLPQLGNSDSRGVATLLQILVIAAGVVAVVMVLLLVASKLRTLQAQRKIALGSLVVGESPLDSAGWLALAQELEGKKSYKEACRAVYMSILHLLDERGIMPFSTTKTNYEYFYALKRMQSVAESFRKLVDLVEHIWFGDKPAREEDFKICMEQARRVRDDLPLRAVPDHHTKAGR